jgi:hypothetical protein
MIPSEHLSRQRAGMNGIFDLSLVKNISLGKRGLRWARMARCAAEF